MAARSFQLSFSERRAPAVVMENSGALAGVAEAAEWFRDATLHPFMLVGAYFRGLIRSTSIAPWCREPVD